MGLMVKRGNPLGVTSLERLLDPEIRFVNRDPDSGTRLLFDQFLAQHKLDPSRINGMSRSNSPTRQSRPTSRAIWRT
jgi:molybdate-binding protein